MISFFMLFSCSCTKENTDTNTKTRSIFEENIDREKQHINLELSNISIDADYVFPDVYKSLKMNRVKAHLPEIDIEKCIELFEINLSGLEKHVNKYYSRDVGTYEDVVYYNYEKYNTTVHFTPFSISGGGEGLSHYSKIYPCIRTDKRFGSYNLDKFSMTDEFDFISRKELFDKLKRAFNQGVGIEISDSYDGYALDYRIMEKEQAENLELMGPKDEWSEEDNAYFFELYQELDGVPICKSGYGDFGSPTIVGPTVLEAWYGKEGWLYYEASNGYVLDKTQEEQSIIDIGQALESLKRKCDLNVELDDKLVIDEIEMLLMPVYIKDGEYEIRPVWVFRGVQHGLMYGWMNILIDGITGKELYSGE